MSQEKIDQMIQQYLADDKQYMGRVEAWMAQRDTLAHAKLLKLADTYRIDFNNDSDTEYELLQRLAGEAIAEALTEIPPEPVRPEALAEQANLIVREVEIAISKAGVAAAPDLFEMFDGENPYDNYTKLSLASEIKIAAGNGVRERYRVGKASLPETLQAFDDLNRKGYMSDLELRYDRNNPTDAGAEKERFLENYLPLRYEQTIVQLQQEPATQNTIDTAKMFLQYPHLVKELPSRWDDAISGSPEDWMQTAARLAPEMALEMRDKLIKNGFEDAVTEAETVQKMRAERQQGSLIQFNPENNPHYAGLQNLPDARIQKIVSAIG